MTFGTLLKSEPMATAIPGATSWRVLYSSKDVTGVPHDVSGLVMAPAEPGADRPLLSWCHGTTGLGDAACPSAVPDPARELTIYLSPESTAQIDYGIPGLADWIAAGFVVCATDYQGLGTDGIHQYAVSQTNGLDALAIAQAARQLGAGAGTTLAVFGWSQGGGAAAAVAELADEDFADLELAACVPISPAVVTASLSAPEPDTAAPSDPPTLQSPHLLMTIYGHAAAFSDLNLGDILTPLGRSLLDAAWNTQPDHHFGDTASRLFHFKGPLVHSSPFASPAWLDAFKKGSAAQNPTRCPVLVCIDEFGGGTQVPVARQEAYAREVENLGGHVEIRRYPDSDHFSVSHDAINDIREWVVSKLASTG